jgi:hypothetical protein
MTALHQEIENALKESRAYRHDLLYIETLEKLIYFHEVEKREIMDDTKSAPQLNDIKLRRNTQLLETAKSILSRKRALITQG